MKLRRFAPVGILLLLFLYVPCSLTVSAADSICGRVTLVETAPQPNGFGSWMYSILIDCATNQAYNWTPPYLHSIPSDYHGPTYHRIYNPVIGSTEFTVTSKDGTVYHVKTINSSSGSDEIASCAACGVIAPPPPTQPSPTDEIRDFDARIVMVRGQHAAQDCRTGEQIFFTDMYGPHFSNPPVVDRYYHFEDALVFEGNPGQMFVVEIESPTFRWWEISGCPTAQPPQVNFTVDRTVIPQAACTILRWNVENARAVYLDGQGVTGHESRTVCPSATTTYYLRVVTDSGDINQSLTVNVTTPPSDNARKISFNVAGTTFSRLKIVGQNQNGIITTWQSPPTSGGYYFLETDDYWWQQTIILEFDVTNLGTRRCVLDYLSPVPSRDTTPITYTDGQGCSGDAGSGNGYRVFVEGLYDAINYDDALGISGELNKASNKLDCLYQIATGIKSPLAVIRVTTSCGGVALDALNNFLAKYKKVVEWQTEIINSLTPVPTTPTPIASYLPGVYVTLIQPQPLQPKRNQGVPFLIDFVNTTGATQNYNLVVQIFSSDTQKGFGETQVQSIAVPMGATQITTPNNWAVRGPGGCIQFYARAFFQSSDNSRTLFLSPDTSTPTAYFGVCP